MGARVAQWWERSPSTNVARVRILASAPYVGWVCCWFYPLLRKGFSPDTPVFPLLKNQHFQIPIWSWTHRHVSTSSHELLSLPWVNKLQLQLQLRSTIFTYLSICDVKIINLCASYIENILTTQFSMLMVNILLLFLSLLLCFYLIIFYLSLYWLFWYWNLHVEDKVDQ